MPESLAEVADLKWIRKGQCLSTNKITFAFNQDSQRIHQAARDADASDMQDWFESDFSVEIEEEVRGLGRYSKTLAVLIAPDLFEKLGELEDSEYLHKSWELKFGLLLCSELP